VPLALIGWLSSDTDGARLQIPELRVTSVRIAGERVTMEAEPRAP
jgi:hypothetical protein